MYEYLYEYIYKYLSDIWIRHMVWKLLQGDIRTVMREGRQLLSNLEASKAVEGAAAEDRDISQDKERVQRYVGYYSPAE